MMIDILNMNGYGLYVWSAFSFTLLGFFGLYLVTKIQFTKERNKFIQKFGALDTEKAKIARSQNINKEILSSSQII